MLKSMMGGLLFSAVVFAQTSTVTSAGYVSPVPISAAPGQIVTLFVDGLGLSSTQPVRAGAGALPASLGGISVTLDQSSAQTPAPIVDVRPVSTCGAPLVVIGQSCGDLAAVTVQIPYELVPPCPLCANPLAAVPAQLVVTENGRDSAPIYVNPLTDQIHVLTACDIVMLAPKSGPLPQPATPGLPCAPLVTHADGSLVTASSPASVGEGLTAWAVGLGQTNPPAATGQVVSSAAPIVQTISTDFNYTVNALPVKPFTGRPDVKPPQAPYTGIVAGSVGLYQINFVVPQQPGEGTPRCAQPGTAGPGANVVQSNLTVSFGGEYSFDGAGICVTTQIPVD